MTKRHPKNERIKLSYIEYLKHADGKAEQTIRQIEKAILRFENFTGFADFRTFDQKQARGFKADLVKQKLATATILSTTTALKRFLGWLASQPGYKSKISLTDVDYLSLSDKDVRAAKAPAGRKYPTIEQVKHVIGLMRSETLIEKRDRAMIAFTALTAVRDGALITLRLKHFDVATRLVTQHPSEVATKGAKHIHTFLCRVGDELEAIVIDWVTLLRTELLFGEDDPLFPKTQMGHDQDDCFIATGLSRDCWANAGPVREIFKTAFTNAGLHPFTPHSFRNMLIKEAYRRKLPPEDLKAWSQNLGHESLLTTLGSYGKVDLERQGELVRMAEPNTDDRPVTMADLQRLMADQKGGAFTRH